MIRWAAIICDGEYLVRVAHEAAVCAHDSFLGDDRLRVSPWQPRQTEELLVHVALVDE